MMLKRAAIIATLAVLVFSTAAAHAGELTLGIQGADSEAYPDVRLTVTVPAELLGEAQVASFVVTENGREAKVLSQDRLSQPEVPVDVVLAIDTSGSMKGASLEAAKHAAMEFVDAMQSPNRVAIIAFDTTAHVVQRFTDDDDALRTAILGLSAGGETAAYDSLVAAAKLAEEAGSNVKGVVLLSDGGDTMSRTSLDEAVRKTRDAGIPVYAVSLPSFEADPEALRMIASQTGGRQVALSDIAVLPALYRDIATEIQTSYVVVYQSRRPQTKDLEIEVSTVVGANSASATTVLPNPRFGQSAAEVGDVLTIAPRNLMSFSGAVSLVGLSSILLVFGIALLILRPRTTIDQLRFYEQLHANSDGLPTLDDATGDGLRAKMVGAVGYVAGQRGLIGMARERLERAGLPLRPAEYITAHLGLVVISGAAVQIFGSNLALSVLVVGAATVGPILYIDMKARTRMRAFEEQLPQILNLIAGSLRAGWGLLQSIDMVVDETLPPASDEFRRVQTESRLGLPLDDALSVMAARVGSDDFAWAVSAISIQREVGGNLAEVLDVVAATIRDRAALRRQVSALTAEGRLSAIILIALPFVEAIVLFAVNPTYMNLMFTTTLGWLMLAGGLSLLAVGSFWLTQAMKVEI